MYDVLILDGEQRSSLAAVRSLGQYGLRVAVASHLSTCLSFSSKYCGKRIVTVDPSGDPSGYIAQLEKEFQRLGTPSVWPMTDITMSLLTKSRGLFSPGIVPIATREQYETLSDKVSLVALATDLDIPVPRSVNFDKADTELLHTLSLDFPLVIKPALSRIASKSGFIATNVTYARTMAEAELQFGTLPWLRSHPFMAQEYIQGIGMGIFALADSTGPYALFSHRRLREKPPSGGCSVLSESVALSEKMVEYTTALIDKVGWQGALMAEFKVTKSGIPYLIEVNGRFWGSLQLAISSGVDFPRLLYQRSCEGVSLSKPEYKVGVKCRWLLGDLDSLYLYLKSSEYSIRLKLGRILQFLIAFLQPMKYDVLWLSDIRPFLTEMRHYVAPVVRRIRLLFTSSRKE